MTNGHTEHIRAVLSFSFQDVSHNHLLLALIDFGATKAQWDFSRQGKYNCTAAYQHKRSVITSGKLLLGSWWKGRKEEGVICILSLSLYSANTLHKQCHIF